MKVKIKHRNKSITVPNVIERVSFFERFSGLMFRTRNTKNMLFGFDNDTYQGIHSYFVFFPFLAIWLDKKNKVLEYQIVKPFVNLLIPKRKFRNLVEVPLNNRNNKIIKFFVGKERFKYK